MAPRWLVLVVFLSACKTVDSGSSVKDDLAGDPAAAADGGTPLDRDLAQIKQACGSANKSLFKGVNGDRSVSYDLDAGVDPARLLQTPSTDGVAKATVDKQNTVLWSLTEPFRDPSLPSCVLDAPLTTAELLYGLGCAKDDPCPTLVASCSGAHPCAAGTAPADSPDPTAANDAGALGLADQPFTCAPLNGNRRNWGFVDPRGRVIGSPDYGWPTQAVCNANLNISAQGLVCAWTGRDVGLYNLATGAQIGAPPDNWGVRSTRDCVTLANTFQNGFVCTWTGDGYAPFNASTGTLIGAVSQSKTLDNCLQKLSYVSHNTLCSFNDKASTIYQADGHSLEWQFGFFGSDDACQEYLQRFNTALDAGAASPLPAVIQAGGTLPEYPSLLVPWHPLGPANGFENYRRCADPSLWSHLARHVPRPGTGGRPATYPQGEPMLDIPPECRFDTLYSWTSPTRLTYLRGLIGRDMPWPHAFQRNRNGVVDLEPLFTTPSPVGSFGYGDMPIRIKIRDGVNYRFVIDEAVNQQFIARDQFCGYYVPQAEWDNTVLVRYLGSNTPDGGHYSALDYILCSPGPIHSWSLGSKQHFDEVARDLAWQLSHDPSQYENYKKTGTQPQLFDFNIDGNDFTRDGVRDRLLTLLRESRLDQGDSVTYNPQLSSRNPAAHFSTRFPSYFNGGN